VSQRLAWLVITTFVVAYGAGAGDETWQPTQSPRQVGAEIIDDLLMRDDYMMYVSDHFTGIHYAEAAAAYGALKFLQLTGDSERRNRVRARYADTPGTDSLIVANHVDANVYGIVPLQYFLLDGDEDKLREGLLLADAQWAEAGPDGLSPQARYWIDDIWMVNSLQVQAYRATGDEKYLDRAARQTDAYLDRLQQDNGLFFHGPDAPFYWGRGNGWVAAGLAELLSELPRSHARYDSINAAYVRMMTALLKYQADDGMWRQLVDHPQAWEESSSTAMFGFAIAVGVQSGILPAEGFESTYQAAWDALVQRIDADGRLSDVCVGTGQSSEVSYYLERPRTTGDFHGQAPLLWFAAVLLAYSGSSQHGAD
jgi:rhamnogalacturonyl hydrolase YesR